MKAIYVILSATPSYIGKCIRLLTHSPYNHVSVSFDDNLQDIMSFARYYYEIPFYGGFIHENIERYINSNILLYRIPIDEASYIKIKEYISNLEMNADEYLYHTINALLCPFHKSIFIEHAHTCVSFTDSLLQLTDLSISPLYEIKQIRKELKAYLIYEGQISSFLLQSNPSYLKNFSTKEKFKLTYKQQMRLLKRLITKQNPLFK